jgi:hypothetical protein
MTPNSGGFLHKEEPLRQRGTRRRREKEDDKNTNIILGMAFMIDYLTFLRFDDPVHIDI